MRYSISLVVLTLLAAAALKGSLSFQASRQKPLFMAAAPANGNQNEDQYNAMSPNVAMPNGLNDQSAQLWRTLTPQQKQAVIQDVQNGMDPNEAVVNYSQNNNQQPANVEDSGSHSTSENYDSAGSDSLENTLNTQNNGTKPAQKNKMTSDAKNYSGSGSSEDEDDTDSQNQGKNDPSKRTIYTPGSENSPAPGNNW